jgi:hypothetical protein
VNADTIESANGYTNRASTMMRAGATSRSPTAGERRCIFDAMVK